MWSLKLKTTPQLSCNLSDIGAGRFLTLKVLHSQVCNLISGLSNQPLNTNILQSRSSLALNLSRSIDRARIRGRLV